MSLSGTRKSPEPSDRWKGRDPEHWATSHAYPDFLVVSACFLSCKHLSDACLLCRHVNWRACASCLRNNCEPTDLLCHGFCHHVAAMSPQTSVRDRSGFNPSPSSPLDYACFIASSGMRASTMWVSSFAHAPQAFTTTLVAMRWPQEVVTPVTFVPWGAERQDAQVSPTAQIAEGRAAYLERYRPQPQRCLQTPLPPGLWPPWCGHFFGGQALHRGRVGRTLTYALTIPVGSMVPSVGEYTAPVTSSHCNNG